MKPLAVFSLLVLAATLGYAAGKSEPVVAVPGFGNPLLNVRIHPGPQYVHEFPLFLFIKKGNPPQMVLWAETVDGKYLTTLYITQKSASQSWMKAPGERVERGAIRRPEALPVWAWKRGVIEADVLPMPTKARPMPDAVTHASSAGPVGISTGVPSGLHQIILWLEVNHSTDFNDRYAPDLPEQSPYYNGGKQGSGQPSLVYSASVNTHEPEKSDRFFRLVGAGSPSGKNGRIRLDPVGIDSALEIIESVELVVGSPKEEDRR